MVVSDGEALEEISFLHFCFPGYLADDHFIRITRIIELHILISIPSNFSSFAYAVMG